MKVLFVFQIVKMLNFYGIVMISSLVIIPSLKKIRGNRKKKIVSKTNSSSYCSTVRMPTLHFNMSLPAQGLTMSASVSHIGNYGVYQFVFYTC